MSKSSIPFERLPDYIKWLKKEVKKSEGQPVQRDFKILLEKAQGRLRHVRAFRKGK